jgi:hypothetical protein
MLYDVSSGAYSLRWLTWGGTMPCGIFRSLHFLLVGYVPEPEDETLCDSEFWEDVSEEAKGTLQPHRSPPPRRPNMRVFPYTRVCGSPTQSEVHPSAPIPITIASLATAH